MTNPTAPTAWAHHTDELDPDERRMADAHLLAQFLETDLTPALAAAMDRAVEAAKELRVP